MTLDFKPISIDMKPMVESYTKPWKLKCSDYTFTNLLIWGSDERISIAEHDDTLFFSLQDEINGRFMFAPLTRQPNGNYLCALETAVEYLLREGIEPRFKAVSGLIADTFAALPGYTLIEDRNNFDYVYAMEDLLQLGGKKFHSKRNHINQFRARYGDACEYVRITPDMIGECVDVYCEWLARKDVMQPGVLGELEAIRVAIANMDALGILGGGIRLSGKLAAFTLGERIDEQMALIHIEKADSDIVGLYTVINQQFIEHEFTDMKFINREEDMGLEGLRRSKLSYNPVKFIEKYEGRPVL